MSSRPSRDGSFRLPADSPPLPLDRALRGQIPGASWSELRRLIETGKVFVSGSVATDPRRLVRGDVTIEIRMTARRVDNPAALPRSTIVHADAHVVVAYKPTGIMSVPFEDERDSFVDLVRRALEKRSGHPVAPLGVVHRIDKATSGLLVFTRRPSAKHSLEQQFRVHSVHRVYVAIVHGALASQTFRSRLVADRGDGLRGSTRNPKLGREAITHVRALRQLGRTSLVECRLETGRTHQIRIHLAEAGHPLVGEPVYARTHGALLEAPRLMLHAAELGFTHPASGEEVKFRCDLPPEFEAFILAEAAREKRL